MKKTFLFISVLCCSLWSANAEDMQNVKVSKSITDVQPMTGLVLWNPLSEDVKDTYAKCYSMEYTYCRPCDVVKGKNQDGTINYDWSPIEKILNDVKSRGHQAILRFWLEYPGEQPDGKTKGVTAVPQYIKDLPGYTETYNKNAGGDGPCYYADWSNPELLWFYKQFYTDFAAKYDGDPRLAFLEVGFGHWGEYHIYGTTLKLGINFPTKEYQAEFLTHINNTFKQLPWAVSTDIADEEYTPVAGNKDLLALNFGLFDDSFMHSEHEISQGDGWNEKCWNGVDGVTTRWKRGVCGGEISYYTDDDQHNFLNPAGMYGVTWEQASSKYHLSFMISNDALDGKYATPARFKEASMACGYRFRLTSCTTNSTETKLTFINEGIAPIYKDAYPAIGLTRSETSLRGLCPGETRSFTIPCTLTSGENLVIVCDHILPTQEIQFNANLSGSGDDPIPVEPTLSFAQEKMNVEVGSTITQVPTTNSDGNIFYVSDAPNIASVDASTGVVTGIAIGKATITATVEATAAYNKKSVQYVVNVIPQGGWKPSEGFTWNASDAMFDECDGEFFEQININGLILNATSEKSMEMKTKKQTYTEKDGTTYEFTRAIKAGGASGKKKADDPYRTLQFDVSGPCTIEIYCRNSSDSGTRTVNLYLNDVTSSAAHTQSVTASISKVTYEYTGQKSCTIFVGADNSMLYYAIRITYPIVTGTDNVSTGNLPDKIINRGRFFLLNNNHRYSVSGATIK
ncbi:MAG: Ig-like domain-containing protein [Paludibacteraceae bacterium]|nr:Ig-like domain-containing protein [Paludibacteraceae bacterium]